MAASKIGGDIDMLVGGASCGAVAEQAAKLPGIRKVFCADSAVFGKPVAEDMEKLILQIHVCAPICSGFLLIRLFMLFFPDCCGVVRPGGWSSRSFIVHGA